MGFTHSIAGRLVALQLAALVAFLGCRNPRIVLSPVPGIPEYQLLNLVPVPGGAVNAAGGNLLIERVDMSIDTMFGNQTVRATYNSALRSWVWNFQMSYDGSTFTDSTGAVYEVSQLADGSSIPGTVWVKQADDVIQTRGGWAFHFDPEGLISHAEWATIAYPRVDYRRYEVAGASMLAIEQCSYEGACSAFFELALDAEGAPVRLEDARTGRVTEYEYSGGELVRVRDPRAIEHGWSGTEYEYDPLWTGLLTAVISSEGERIEYEYQADNRIRDVIAVGEGNPTDHFEFNAPRSYTSDFYSTLHTNPLGGQTRYFFDPERRLRWIERVATGEGTTLDYWLGLGMRPTRVVTASGVTTLLGYAGDDLVQIREPTGNLVSISYATGGLNFANPYERPISRVEDSLGLIEERTLDPQGRVVTVVNGEGEVTTATWGPLALASLTNPLGGNFQFPVYGEHGHWLEMSGSGVTDSRFVDPVGNIIIPSARRRPGGTLTRGYDGNRKLDSLAVAATAEGAIVSQGTIAIDRRSDGQILYVSRPGGADHAFEYDAIGRLVRRKEQVDGVWQTTHFEFDLGGNPTAVIRPNGMREDFEYDAYGRVVAHRASRDGLVEGVETFVYQNGQLVSRYDSLRDATEVYGYDSAGLPTSVGFEMGETWTIQYDLRSRVAAESFVLPAQGEIRQVEYEYDLANRLTRLGADAGELLAEWRYQDGVVESIDYGNGLTRTFAYDPATFRMTSAATLDEEGATLESTSISRSAEVGPLREQVLAQTETDLASTVERYSMTLGGSLSDPDRYVGQQVFAWEDGAGNSKHYAYDALSNPLDSASGDTFSYNAEGNRLLAASLAHEGETVGYSYDAAGFATTRNGVPIGWTATGRMASFGADSIDWDMRGRPISITVAGQTSDFVYFGGRVSNDPETGQLGALDLGVVSVEFGSSGRLYRHLDFRNNVSFVSDETGAIVSHYRYSAYALDEAFGADVDGLRFVGREQLGELMWLGARVYDPLVGRFLSPDPVFGAVNQFSYALGNPIRFWDPDGAFPQPLTAEQVDAVLTAEAVLFGGIAATAGGLAAIGLAPEALVAAGLAGAIAAIAVGGYFAYRGLHDAFSAPEPGGGPCKRRCGGPQPSKQRRDIQIEIEVAGGDLGQPGGCTPAALARLPDMGRFLIFLVPAQLLLGCLLLRSRHARDVGEGRK